MNEKEYDSFVLAVLHKNSSSYLRTAGYDLSQFLRPSHVPGLPEHIRIFTESHEITETIINQDILQVLCSPSGKFLFQELIITDQPVKRPEKYRN